MASIQLLHQFNGYTPGFHDFGAVENARLVALGLARSWTVEADGGQSFDDTLTSTEVAATRALVSGAGNIYYVPSPSGGDDAPVLRTYFAIPNAVLYLTDGEYLLGTEGHLGASERPDGHRQGQNKDALEGHGHPAHEQRRNPRH